MILYQTATVKTPKALEGHSGPHFPVWVPALSFGSLGQSYTDSQDLQSSL